MAKLIVIMVCMMFIRLSQAGCKSTGSLLSPTLRYYKKREDNTDCLSCLKFSESVNAVSPYDCEENENINSLLTDLSTINCNNRRTFYRFGRAQIQSCNLSVRVIIKYKNKNSTELSPDNDDNTTPPVPKSLIDLDYSGNKVSKIYPGYFDRFASLLELSLANNLISTIDAGIFSSLIKMQKLNISHNNIRNVNEKTFENLLDLFILDLSFNNIREISRDVFSQQNHLELLILKNNHITQFNVDLQKSILPSFALDLSFNKLEEFNVSENFESLTLSHNNLSSWSVVMTPSVKLLNLSYNNIKVISPHSFLNATNLLILDISHNLLTSMPTNSFKNVTQVKFVDVSYNLFHEISYADINNWISFFLNFKFLRSVYLDGNFWKCEDLKDIVHSLMSRGIDIDAGNKHDDTNVKGIYCRDVGNNSQEIKFNPFEHIQMIIDKQISDEINKLYLNYSDIQNNVSDIRQIISSFGNKIESLNSSVQGKIEDVPVGESSKVVENSNGRSNDNIGIGLIITVIITNTLLSVIMCCLIFFIYLHY